MTNIPSPNQFNLNPLHPEIREGISLITAIKNRKETFEEALKTCTGREKIDKPLKCHKVTKPPRFTEYCFSVK